MFGDNKSAMHYAYLRNYLGIAEIHGSDFQRIARMQVGAVGARLREERVLEVSTGGERFTVTLESGEQVTASGWCVSCEQQHDTWSHQHAADIIWQAFTGAGIAMLFGLGAPLIGLSPLLGIVGVLTGTGTFVGVRAWSKRRRRQQLLTSALPRAYLPSKT